jgi:ATP-dependent DNA helicase RecG
MDLGELQILIDQGESETLEFKRSTGRRSDAARTACAMLNGLGGFVIFGVADDGTIVGQDVSEKTLRYLANEFRRIEPPADALAPGTETLA